MTFKSAYGFMDEVIRDCLAGKILNNNKVWKKKKYKKHDSLNTQYFFFFLSEEELKPSALFVTDIWTCVIRKVTRKINESSFQMNIFETKLKE